MSKFLEAYAQCNQEQVEAVYAGSSDSAGPPPPPPGDYTMTVEDTRANVYKAKADGNDYPLFEVRGIIATSQNGPEWEGKPCRKTYYFGPSKTGTSVDAGELKGLAKKLIPEMPPNAPLSDVVPVMEQVLPGKCLTFRVTAKDGYTNTYINDVVQMAAA